MKNCRYNLLPHIFVQSLIVRLLIRLFVVILPFNELRKQHGVNQQKHRINIHEILHVKYSNESLIPNTSAFCDDHNRINQMSIDTLVALKLRVFTYLLDRHIYSGGNQRKQCQSV